MKRRTPAPLQLLQTRRITLQTAPDSELAIIVRMFRSTVSKLRSAVQVRHSSDVAGQYRRALAAITDKNAPQRDVSPTQKLKLYGLFKQIETGPCTGSRPGIFDPIGRAKHDAWAGLGDMSKEDAMQSYIKEALEIFDGKLPAETATISQTDAAAPASAPAATAAKPVSVASVAFPKKHPVSIDSLGLTTIQAKPAVNGVQHVVLNRPKRGNAFDMRLWEDYRKVFEAVGNSEDAKVVVLSGAGGNFSTGMDLTVFAEMQACGEKESCDGRRREGIAKFIQYLQDATSAPETCAVPVIAAVSGHCIGGAIDIITACDLRYCTKDASFCVKEVDLAIVSVVVCSPTPLLTERIRRAVDVLCHHGAAPLHRYCAWFHAGRIKHTSVLVLTV